jgi:HD-like signal output (HDOD) protein
MASLFFWRKDKPAAPQAPVPVQVPAMAAPESPPAASSPGATEPTPSVLPLQRLVLAVALRDERAADPAIRLDAAQTRLLLAASHEFARVGTEPRYTPQRPSLLPQLMEVLSDEEASLRALSRIIAQDPQLTGDLLRTANSPLYRVSATPVESVERATVLLGTSGLRTLIAGALLSPMKLAEAGDVGHFGEIMWEYAMYSASAAEAWAARNQSTDPFAAHLVSLLYGVGSVTVYRVLADQYAAQSGLQPDAAAIASSVETNAAVTAARIAASWGLSERTREALESQSAAAPVSDAAPLALALQFGLLAGALTLLCRHGRLTAGQAPEQLALAGFTGPAAERTWDRMANAYIVHR